MPTAQELATLYSCSWTNPEQFTSETGGTTLDLARIYVTRLLKALGRSTLAGLTVLDFGAGRGAMLQALREAGAQPIGVEPYGAEHLRALGFEAYTALSDVQRTVDGIVSIDLIEHLPEPWNTLRDLHARLGPHGWLYVSTPNPRGLNAVVNKGSWREAKKPGHLLFLSPRTLCKMLQQAGFRNVRRLRWLVKYHKNPLRRIVNYSLQILGVDGALRYLAYRDRTQ